MYPSKSINLPSSLSYPPCDVGNFLGCHVISQLQNNRDQGFLHHSSGTADKWPLQWTSSDGERIAGQADIFTLVWVGDVEVQNVVLSKVCYEEVGKVGPSIHNTDGSVTLQGRIRVSCPTPNSSCNLPGVSLSSQLLDNVSLKIILFFKLIIHFKR